MFKSINNYLTDKRIPYARHDINRSDIRSVTRALKGDWLTIGPLVEEFENQISYLTDSPAVVVSSGTAALHCVYNAININQGDEIITPAITFAATQATASILGAKVKFADVDYRTGNIDLSSVKKLITNNTKAIVCVDFAGQTADLDELLKITKEKGIYLIEDAAHSFGSKYKNRSVGSIADLTTFSFFATKNITTGEGGAVTSTNKELLDRVRVFARQGLVRNPTKFNLKNEGEWHQEVQSLGINYRLPDVLCALGISQIKKLEKYKSRRQEIFNFYNENLKGIDEIITPYVENYSDPFWHLYAIKVTSGNRRNLFDYLRSNGVWVQVNYLPVYKHPYFAKDLVKPECPMAEQFYKDELSLPLHTKLRKKDLLDIIRLIHKFKFIKS
jgi:dTDP-4-amino-4,6-dideoxygalactose transaminase